jgi:site-specific DNA recombinase
MTTPPRYAAVYARVSTEDQGRGYSIPTQIEACRIFAKEHGYTVPDTHVFLDEGISGAILERPALEQVRSCVRARTIAAVLVYDLDRLSRKLVHQLMLTEECERAEVALHFVLSPADTSPEGTLFLQMKGAFAELDRAKILERTRRGRNGRATAGHVLGGLAPFGYRYVSESHKGHYEIEEAEAAVVRRIFAMCVEGGTVRGIATRLTQERVPTAMDRGPRGGGRKKKDAVGVWALSAVHRLLRNPIYVGTAFFNKRKTVSSQMVQTPDGMKTRRQRGWRDPAAWIALAVPAIIDDASFQAAQAQIERNKALSFRNRKPTRTYLLRGRWFRCGRCGLAMTGYTNNHGRYYRCSSRQMKTDPAHRCRSQIRGDEAERRVWAAIMQILDHPGLVSAEVAKQQSTIGERDGALASEIAAIETALARCEEEDRRLVDAYVAGAFTVAELKAYRADVVTRHQALEGERQSVCAKREALQQARGQTEALETYCARVRDRLTTFSVEEQQLAFDALAVMVRWMPGEPLHIEASIPLDGIVSQPARWDRCLCRHLC